jgi:Lon protease-like protein
MFPLGSVLLPHSPLTLHVFEPRYRALMTDVLDGDRTFGVVLIERGSEVGGGDQRSMMGTIASIARAIPAPDGRWAVVAVGGARIDVGEWLPDDPYPIAEVRERVEQQWPVGIIAADQLLESTEALVRRALWLKGELDEPAAPPAVILDPTPSIKVWQLAAVAPLGDYDRQQLLAIDDPVERLRLLHELAAEEATVLAHRAQGL